MPTTKEIMEVLNDLIRINNHWIEGYESALKELKIADADLKVLSQHIIEKDKQTIPGRNKEEKPSVYTTGLQNVFIRILVECWINCKAIFSPQGREHFFESVKKGYKKDVASENILTTLKELIESQKSILKSSQDDIKASRGIKL